MLSSITIVMFGTHIFVIACNRKFICLKNQWSTYPSQLPCPTKGFLLQHVFNVKPKSNSGLKNIKLLLFGCFLDNFMFSSKGFCSDHSLQNYTSFLSQLSKYIEIEPRALLRFSWTHLHPSCVHLTIQRGKVMSHTLLILKPYCSQKKLN